jgi:hypothetical protein
MSTCHCFCRTWHPDSAQSASCSSPATPGLNVLASAALVGIVQVAVCRPCFEARRSEQPGGCPRR